MFGANPSVGGKNSPKAAVEVIAEGFESRDSIEKPYSGISIVDAAWVIEAALSNIIVNIDLVFVFIIFRVRGNVEFNPNVEVTGDTLEAARESGMFVI